LEVDRIITMPHISIQYYKSLIGELLLGSYDGKLCLADMRYRKMRPTIDARIQQGLKAKYVKEGSEVIAETIKQMEEYFAGARRDFDAPLLMVGTDFQKSVWRGLMRIPYVATDPDCLTAEVGYELSSIAQ